jgi:hypothetical protein
MLLDSGTLDRIARGEVSLAFRRWRRPTVRPGGTLLTSAGQLEIRAVDIVDTDTITEEEAGRAGYASRQTLLAELDRRGSGDTYRIELGALGPDPRVALREARPDELELTELRRRLARLDAASPDGPWTLKTLRAIRSHPALRAGDLCRLVGQERDRFKPNVRKLKNLGLTISLETGYRLSTRGEACLHDLESAEVPQASAQEYQQRPEAS